MPWIPAAGPRGPDQEELDEHGDVVSVAPVGEVDDRQAPDPGDDGEPEAGPGDLTESGRRQAGCLGGDLPQDWDEGHHDDLAADPATDTEQVQEDADGVEVEAGGGVGLRQR